MITQSYPKVKFTKEKKVFISFYSMGRRYRIFNGQLFNINIYPNDFPIHIREAKAQLLALKIFEVISNENISENKTPSDIEYLKAALESHKSYADYLRAQNRLMQAPEFGKMFETMGKGNITNPSTIARTMLMMWNAPKE